MVYQFFLIDLFRPDKLFPVQKVLLQMLLILFPVSEIVLHRLSLSTFFSQAYERWGYAYRMPSKGANISVPLSKQMLMQSGECLSFRTRIPPMYDDRERILLVKPFPCLMRFWFLRNRKRLSLFVNSERKRLNGFWGYISKHSLFLNTD